MPLFEVKIAVMVYLTMDVEAQNVAEAKRLVKTADPVNQVQNTQGIEIKKGAFKIKDIQLK